MTKDHFSVQLNYTLANEDATPEHSVLPARCEQVLAVAGSGSRVVPLLAKQPARLVCVDVSRPQLFLTELRLELIKNLNRSQYLAFWGYPGEWELTAEEKRQIFESLSLGQPAREYLLERFQIVNWGELLYQGHWEQTMQKISQAIQWLVGSKALDLFRFSDQNEYRTYYQKNFPRLRWRLAVALLSHKTVFNALLYKGGLPRANLPEGSYRFYLRVFDELFEREPVRNNFFLQLLFWGRLIDPVGLPLECDQDIYIDAQRALRDTEVELQLGDVIQVGSLARRSLDFVSMSDTPSYFSPARESSFLQDLKPALRSGAWVVNRYYLRRPVNLDTAGFVQNNHLFESEIKAEKVNMYQFGIFQKK